MQQWKTSPFSAGFGQRWSVGCSVVTVYWANHKPTWSSHAVRYNDGQRSESGYGTTFTDLHGLITSSGLAEKYMISPIWKYSRTIWSDAISFVQNNLKYKQGNTLINLHLCSQLTTKTSHLTEFVQMTLRTAEPIMLNIFHLIMFAFHIHTIIKFALLTINVFKVFW